VEETEKGGFFYKLGTIIENPKRWMMTKKILMMMLATE
jgi:hypothetical protein